MKFVGKETAVVNVGFAVNQGVVYQGFTVLIIYYASKKSLIK